MRQNLIWLLVLLFTLPAIPAWAIDLTRGIMFDVPDHIMTQQFGRIPPSVLTREDSLAIASYRFRSNR